MRSIITWSIGRHPCSYKQASQVTTRFRWGKRLSTVLSDDEKEDVEMKKESQCIHALEKKVLRLEAQNKELLRELATITKQKTVETVPSNSHQWSPVYQFRDGIFVSDMS